MKIFHIMASSKDGGAEIFFADAVKAINSIGLQQFALVHPKYKKIGDLLALNVPIKTASFNQWLRWPTNKIIDYIIREFNPDIIHYWMGRAASFSVIKKTHINVGWHSGYRGVKRFKNCSFHFALTKELMIHLEKQGINKKKILVLPNYTPFMNGKPIDREIFNTPKNKTLLLLLARLHPVKGIDTLIKALPYVKDTYLWIAGSGPLENELKRLTKELSLDRYVKFLGWRDDRDDLIASSDICIFPSRNDSFGAVTIEAWSAKKPFIATRAPGPKAMIHDGVDGILVEVDDVKGLAKSINRLKSDTELQKKLKINGYKRYKKEFSEEVFKYNIYNFYNVIKNS